MDTQELNNMTKQAQNSINLYKGQPISLIKQALTMQGKSTVEELKQHFNASTIEDLAVKLSIG